MFNSIQLFGLILLGGLTAGEFSRRVARLPRTTGYVVFGLVIGQSGLGWVGVDEIDNAQLFIDLALGLILFELGYLVPRADATRGRERFVMGLSIALATGAALWFLFTFWGFGLGAAWFAAALCLATSPAITIATCSDVGAQGERTGLLYTLVAGGGAVAFAGVALVTPFIQDNADMGVIDRVVTALGSIVGSGLLGGACAGIVLAGAERLERQPEHQHLLILGTIVLGVGTAIYLGVSVFLPMLLFGILVSAIDREHKVLAIRIASDARVFLVITFVLAGAALNIAYLKSYWQEALVIVGVRFLAQLAGILASRKDPALSVRHGALLAVGLQPMSSISLVLLVNTQLLYTGMRTDLVGMLMATILLMQLLGPLATQTAIVGFGEATRLTPRRGSDEHSPSSTNHGSPS